MKKKERIGNLFYHIIVCGVGFIMIYPLLWMVMSSFKESSSIFHTASSLLPKPFTMENYQNGWKGFAGIGFGVFIKNSFFITIVATIGSLISSIFVAYAFARLNFPGKKLLFAAMMISMMLPGQILMIPRYLWFQKLDWINTYLPMTVPFYFAIEGFFIYLLTNFIGGIPRDLDEAAKIDGCSHYGIFTRIILPLASPSLVTVGIFSFIWRWDDFLSPLLYINKSKMYPVSLALKLFSDPGAGTDYGAMFAMATISILPALLLFIFCQKYLVEGIASSGIKG